MMLSEELVNGDIVAINDKTVHLWRRAVSEKN